MTSYSFKRSLSTSVLAGFILISACSDNSSPAPAEIERRPVKTFKIDASSSFLERLFPGTVQSAKASRLSFRVAGRIDSIPVKLGQRLSKNQLIAKLDNTDYQLEVQKANAGVTEAKANFRNANVQYERIQSLYESDSASKNELDVARAGFESARAGLTQAKNGLKLVKQQLSYTELRSPDANCEIGSLAVKANENIGAGSEIASIHCGDGFEVESRVPESVISALNIGDVAEVRFTSLINVAAASASISEIASDSVGGGGYQVKLKLNEISPDVKPGMAADVAFKVGSDIQSIRVPLNAVLSDGETNYVFVFQAEQKNTGSVVKKQVSVGEITNNGVLEIYDGLEVGDEVIVAGIQHMRDGLAVKRYMPAQ